MEARDPSTGPTEASANGPDHFLDALETAIGSAPGLAEATNLEELRNEWRR